jgi:hypothetical protein
MSFDEFFKAVNSDKSFTHAYTEKLFCEVRENLFDALCSVDKDTYLKIMNAAQNKYNKDYKHE